MHQLFWKQNSVAVSRGWVSWFRILSTEHRQFKRTIVLPVSLHSLHLLSIAISHPPALLTATELQRTSIPGFFACLQEEGVCDMYFSYQGCQIDINSPTSSVSCPKATLVISYTKPFAFKVGVGPAFLMRVHAVLGWSLGGTQVAALQQHTGLGVLLCRAPQPAWHA